MYNKLSIILMSIFTVCAYAQPNDLSAVLDDAPASGESGVVIKNNSGASSKPVIVVGNPQKATAQVPPMTADYSNISKNDSASARLARLNQDYQIAQAQQKIDQLNNAGNGHNNVAKTKGKAVVTGVMINEAGNRLATLRFPDGGTLDVEIGTILKNMKVTDINMNGVEMVSTKACKSKNCKPTSVFYERVYDAPQYSGTNTQVQNGINQPTSVIPFSSNSMVPPIVTSN